MEYIKEQVAIHDAREGSSSTPYSRTGKKNKREDESSDNFDDLNFDVSDEEAPKKRPKRSIKRQSKSVEPSLPPVTAPPPLSVYIEQMFSNKVQAMHMVWILQANKRGIITEAEMDHLQCLPYNNQSPFFIVTLFNVLYDCLKCESVDKAKMKWAEEGMVLFHELLMLMERRRTA
jgi:hypothetical protein